MSLYTGHITGRVSREYQDQAIQFLRTCDAYLLADPPGAGKTLMSLSTVRMDHGQTLIVTNSAVTYFWEREIHDWVSPKARVAVYEPWNSGSAKFWNQAADFFIIYWEALRYNEAFLKGRVWGTKIADEAHRMKNRNTKQSKLIRGVPAGFRYALTASPIMNSPAELWAVLNYLHPKAYSSYWKYFEGEVLAMKQPFGGYKVIGWKDAAGMTTKLRRFTIRRKKKTILPELPDKQYTRIDCVLTPKQRSAYDQMFKQFVATLPDGKVVISPTVLSQLIRLRQFACGLHLVGGPEESSKLDKAVTWGVNYLEENPDESIVAFSQFVPMTHALQRRFEAAGYATYLITGEDVKDKAERDRMVQDFQNGKRRVFIATTQTMGESATLTKASVVLIMDQLWNPQRQEQAEDRLHRIGQKNSVQVIIFEAADTVEQKIAKRLAEKGEFAGAVMDREELIGLAA